MTVRVYQICQLRLNRYKGPYAGMETAYGEFMKWLEEAGLKPVGPWFEYYLNSSQEVPESELLTRIQVPVE
ncbi:MAG: GyrI-like domain-containing protein [Dehalogenimonas sp.]